VFQQHESTGEVHEVQSVGRDLDNMEKSYLFVKMKMFVCSDYS